MTTILVARNKLFADKRITVETNILESGIINDTFTKIFVTTNLNIFVKRQEADEEKYKILAMGFCGDAAKIEKFKAQLAIGEKDLTSIIRDCITTNIKEANEIIGGCFIAEKGIFGEFSLAQVGSFCQVSDDDKMFASAGSGSCFDIASTFDSYDGDAESLFLSFAYLDHSSSVIYDKIDTENIKVETVSPSEEQLKQAVLKNFNSCFYTGFKRVFN